MDFKETEDRNDCAGEGQQQFIQMTKWLGNLSSEVMNCEMVASWEQHKYKSRRISTVGNCNKQRLEKTITD
jgi:hypothetical protein